MGEEMSYYYYPNAIEIVNNYFSNKDINFLFGSVEKYKVMHGYKPWMVKLSFGFYTSHSVGFFIKTLDHNKVGFYNVKYLPSLKGDMQCLFQQCHHQQ